MRSAERAVRCGDTLRKITGCTVRAVVTVTLTVLLGISRVLAHEGIHTEAAQDFLNRIDVIQTVIASAELADEKADALYDLGETLSQVTQLLNRDLASQGGKPSTYSRELVAALKARGVELSFSQSAKRYESYLGPFEEYLALAPEGSRRSDAMFRLLYGRFYDSFVSDPLELLNLNWADLVDQIEAAETFLSLHSDHPDREEVQFILAIDYARAAREARDKEAARSYRERARAALTEFQDTFPDSLRAIAAQVLIKRLPPAD